MYPTQEDSLAKARAIREAWLDDSHYELPRAEWESIIVDLASLIETLRPQGDPPDALPGTVRALQYQLAEITTRYPEMHNATVTVDDSIGGQTPIVAVEQCNFDVSLIIDHEFWDEDIHGANMREALELIGTDCENYTVGRCFDPVVQPVRTPDAENTADRWCDQCIAARGLGVE